MLNIQPNYSIHQNNLAFKAKGVTIKNIKSKSQLLSKMNENSKQMTAKINRDNSHEGILDDILGILCDHSSCNCTCSGQSHEGIITDIMNIMNG